MGRDLVLAARLGFLLYADRRLRGRVVIQGRLLRYDPRLDAARRCRLVVAALSRERKVAYPIE